MTADDDIYRVFVTCMGVDIASSLPDKGSLLLDGSNKSMGQTRAEVWLGIYLS